MAASQVNIIKFHMHVQPHPQLRTCEELPPHFWISPAYHDPNFSRALPQNDSHFSCLELRSLPSWISGTAMLCLHISHWQKAWRGSPHEFPSSHGLESCTAWWPMPKRITLSVLFNVIVAYIGRATPGLATPS